MKPENDLQKSLSRLPAVDELLHRATEQGLLECYPRTLVAEFIRGRLQKIKDRIISQKVRFEDIYTPESFTKALREDLENFYRPKLKPVINATGVVVHTNLGRSSLAAEILPHLSMIAGRYSNLEYDLEAGGRSIRYANVEELLCRLTGAEAAMVVNNNAGAVLLSLSALASGREVVVSRGELVEIGGAFRIPEVIVQGGAILREVGATNRTHLHDYEDAINENTAVLLKVHTSNYRISGYTKQVEARELTVLGRKYGIPVVEDLGSGCLTDLKPFGLTGEPTVKEVIKGGVSLATFSGDKLLGGPQAGIIVGSVKLVDELKKHPLNRALRIDKMTLAGLEEILKLHLDPAVAVDRIPTLKMLTLSDAELKGRAQRLKRIIGRGDQEKLFEIELKPGISRAGGGALPLVELPTWLVFLRSGSANPVQLERRLRRRPLPIIVRIVDDWLVFDPRTLFNDDYREISRALQEICRR